MPVIFLVGVGVWAQLRPQAVEAPPKLTARKPVRLATKAFKLVPLTAADVEKGADTKVAIELVPQGNVSGPMAKVDWRWSDAIEVRTAKGEKLFDSDSWRAPVGSGPVVGFGGSSISGWPLERLSYSKTMLLRLRDVAPERGAIELRWNIALKPKVSTANGQAPATNMAQSATSERAPTLAKTLILRHAGETIKKPSASTAPLFDVRKVTITPSKKAMRTGPIKVVIDVFYRGDLGNLENGTLPANTRWKLVGRDGRAFYDITSENFFQATGASRRGQIVETFDFSTRKNSFKDQPLILRGRMSLNEAWHKNVDIPIS